MGSQLLGGRPAGLALVMATGVMALVLGGFLSAQEQRPEVKLTVEGGIEGWVDPFWPMKLVARIESDVLLVGHLQVVQGQELARVEVEVPAGGVRTYEVVVAPPADQGAILLRLIPDGPEDRDPVASAFFRPRVADGEILVGVVGLPGLEQTLAQTRSAMSGDPITPVGVEDPSEMLERGEFRQLSYLVLGLPRPLPEATVSWLRGGGRLVTTVEALDSMGLDAVRWGDFPGDGEAVGWYGVGEGEVLALTTLSGHDPGFWATLLRPVRLPPGLSPRFGEGPVPLTQAALAVETDTPRYSWLPWVVIGYAGLVGPVNLWLLRRRRRLEWAWLTIPLMGLAGVAAFWTVGAGGVNQVFWSHGTVQVAGEDPQVRSGVVAAASRAETLEIAFDPDWDVFPENLGGFSGDFSQPTVTGAGVHRYHLSSLGWLAVNAFRREEPLDLAVEFSEQGFELANHSSAPVPLWGVHAYPKTVLGQPLEPGDTASMSWESVPTADSFWAIGDAFWEFETRERFEDWNQNWRAAVGNLLNMAAGSQMVDAPSFVFAVVEESMGGMEIDGRRTAVPGLKLTIFPIPPEQMGETGWAYGRAVWLDDNFRAEGEDDELALSGISQQWILSYRLPAGLSASPRLVLGGLDPDFGGFDDGRLWVEEDVGATEEAPGWEAWDWNAARFVQVDVDHPLDTARLVASSGEALFRVSGPEFGTPVPLQGVMMWGDLP